MAGVAGGEGGLHAVLLVDFGAHTDDLHKLLDKHRENGEKNGMKFREEEVDEAKLISFQAPQQDDGDDGAPADAGAYFIRDTFFVAGDDVQTLKDVLHRWDGKHEETFAEHETYQYVLDKCREEGSTAQPLFAWFINPIGVIEAISTAHPEIVGQMAGAVALFPTIGVDKFKGVGGVVYNQHHAFCLETQHFPDSINHPTFPSVILRPGQTFRSTTIFRFGTLPAR